MFRVSWLDIWWCHDIWISEKLNSDYLKNKKSFGSEKQKAFFLVSKVLAFRDTKQTSKNVVDSTLEVYLGFFNNESYYESFKNANVTKTVTIMILFSDYFQLLGLSKVSFGLLTSVQPQLSYVYHCRKFYIYCWSFFSFYEIMNMVYIL